MVYCIRIGWMNTGGWGKPFKLRRSKVNQDFNSFFQTWCRTVQASGSWCTPAQAAGSSVGRRGYRDPLLPWMELQPPGPGPWFLKKKKNQTFKTSDDECLFFLICRNKCAASGNLWSIYLNTGGMKTTCWNVFSFSVPSYSFVAKSTFIYI